MPTTRAMEAQFQTLLEKLTEMNANMGEMKSDLTSMNANMGEMKSELTASMNANMTEMKSELTTNIAEVNTKLTNVNEQISANKEELKSDLKGIGDKLTTMDKKFEEMEGRIESVENKFEDMESKLEAKIFEKVEEVSISFRSDLEKLKQKVMTGQGDEFKFQAPYSKPSIKLSTYDGKSSWQVYKTQFSIVADANQWDSQTKACQLAASLRADAADILQTLPETQRLDFDALVNALELRFGEKCVKDYSRLQLKSRQQKVSETLQELATDVERLSHLAFSDCPTEVREVLALQHFIDGVRDPEIQKALRMADLKDLKGALVFAMKFEATCSPVTCVCKSSSLLLSNSPQQLTPDLLENAELSPEQKNSAERLFQEFEDVFSRNSSDIGHTTVTQHRIDTADHPPIKQHPRRLPFAKQEEVGTLLREMQENDIIEPSSSPWASPIVLVRKKDGSTRFCVDYRKLNDVTKKDSYPLPRIDDTLDTLSGHKWFSTLDLKSGYWQVEIHPEDREKQHSLPAKDYGSSKSCRGRTFEEHLQNIRKVLSKLRDANLKLNPSKCKFFQKEVNYLGHIISAEGVRTDPEKVSAVKNWKRPENLRELQSFLGLCTYYRKFVKGFSNIARPLHKLTESKQKFQWTKECEDSFLQLKETLTSSPILIYPQPDKPFILDTDASNESVGAVLSQEIDGQERVVAYWSKCLSKPERNYCVTRKELLAIVKAIEHFHHYLYGQKFLLRTDHASLTWLMNFRNTEGQVARWIQRLNEYYFDIRHRKGSSHGNADALSRRPCPENCRHCSRVETKYDYAIRQITTSTATPPDPWSDEKVREDQMADPDIKPLIEFMESSSNKPSWQDISAYSPTTKQYWALWNSLHLRNGVLYRKFESEDGKTFRWQLVLPRSRIPEVLKELHGSPTGGHFGVMKTLHRVRERFCWGKVRADVEQWCKSCDACSAQKGPKIRSRGKLHRYNVGAPFERIAFDILGPLPRTASGNKYLLVVMDYFTKWPEVYPIPDQEAPTVAEAVVQHWISRYGVPLQLHSDQGRNFVSAVLKGVCELLGIDKTKTTPLHPQSDGMVERFNRTILNNLSLVVSKNQQDWDQKVPLFLLAYRSAVHETTGYSPSQMLFGRDLRLPCDLLFGRPPDTPSSPEEYVQNLQARFEDVHNLARERINLRTEKMKTRYDTKATGHQFKEGDKVWFYNPTRRKELSPKLQSHWDGPYTILKIINDVVIRIRKSTNSKPRVVHYDRLAPYYGHNS
ncbi:retrovirus-related Pol polyprotein from transposon 412 [Trichonephila clavipes]|uniref:RNA-directed DNA polymerase n=1 Tax=Trichonephila clavipes TaxID=2585209 RepID=A0A8X6RR11_TRICX|nr:retrovirus-related Pol polyprotein from transposon 412 [Trichonephila clavipes]